MNMLSSCCLMGRLTLSDTMCLVLTCTYLHGMVRWPSFSCLSVYLWLYDKEKSINLNVRLWASCVSMCLIFFWRTSLHSFQIAGKSSPGWQGVMYSPNLSHSQDRFWEPWTGIKMPVWFWILQSCILVLARSILWISGLHCVLFIFSYILWESIIMVKPKERHWGVGAEGRTWWEEGLSCIPSNSRNRLAGKRTQRSCNKQQITSGVLNGVHLGMMLDAACRHSRLPGWACS